MHRGSLYLTDYRAIFFDRWYAPARVMPLLDALRWQSLPYPAPRGDLSRAFLGPFSNLSRRHSLPDIDIVFAAVDEPRVKMLVEEAQWTRTVGKYPGKVAGAVKLPPPIFSSTVNRAHHHLPWPDSSTSADLGRSRPISANRRTTTSRGQTFRSTPRARSTSCARRHGASCTARSPEIARDRPRSPEDESIIGAASVAGRPLGSSYSTAGWNEFDANESGKMLRQSEGVRWEDKIELAMHTGNVGSPFRKRLAAAAAAHPDSMLVNELFIGDHGEI